MITGDLANFEEKLLTLVTSYDAYTTEKPITGAYAHCSSESRNAFQDFWLFWESIFMAVYIANF